LRRHLSDKPTFYEKGVLGQVDFIVGSVFFSVEGLICTMLFSDQLSIRTVIEPVALCLLESNERSMLPFIGRPRRSSRLRSHRDTV